MPFVKSPVFDVATDLRAVSKVLRDHISLKINRENLQHMSSAKGVKHGFKFLISFFETHNRLANTYSLKHKITIILNSIPELRRRIEDCKVSLEDCIGLKVKLPSKNRIESIIGLNK